MTETLTTRHPDTTRIKDITSRILTNMETSSVETEAARISELNQGKELPTHD